MPTDFGMSAAFERVKRSGVGRIKINDEQTPARFREGTLGRIDAVLKDKEKRSDFIRTAVEAELVKREGEQVPSTEEASEKGASRKPT